MMTGYNLEELGRLNDGELGFLVAYLSEESFCMGPIPRYATDLNVITSAVQGWCGDFGIRPQMFVQALAEVLRVRVNIHAIITLGYRFATVTARDLSMALVLAAQGEGE